MNIILSSTFNLSLKFNLKVSYFDFIYAEIFNLAQPQCCIERTKWNRLLSQPIISTKGHIFHNPAAIYCQQSSLWAPTVSLKTRHYWSRVYNIWINVEFYPAGQLVAAAQYFMYFICFIRQLAACLFFKDKFLCM